MENNIEQFVSKIINGDCVEVMKTLPEGSVGLDQIMALMNGK